MNKLPQPLRLLFVACAGVGTFYLTSQWAMGSRGAQAGLEQVVVPPAPRPRTVVGVPAAAAASPTASAAAPDDALPAIAERAKSIPSSKGDPFAHLSWLPPPPPAPPLPTPAPTPLPQVTVPVAPPLPFTFVGMLERSEGKPSAFLAKGEALLIVAAGDTLDNGAYRVESLTATEIVMTYVPLNTQQTLSVSGRTK
jgi:hypothetical protein